MRWLPERVDPKFLPDLAHHREHGIDRVTAWCLMPLCFHQAPLTFADLATHGARDTTTLWDIATTKVYKKRPTKVRSCSQIGPNESLSSGRSVSAGSLQPALSGIVFTKWSNPHLQPDV
jgi:hypothetical protein